MRSYKNILVTGGAGFIGSNFLRTLLEKHNFSGNIINLDKLTYAGHLESLTDLEDKFGGENYFFEQGDIGDFDFVQSIFKKYEVEAVINFAAESHVDRSISGPQEFVKTNVVGTTVLLEVARQVWGEHNDKTLFFHVSTDEVYGSLGEQGEFLESTAYSPNSPYSASKASSDHFVKAYGTTYGLNTLISNCSNNYGPYQFPEKLIPVTINNLLANKEIPVYGTGSNVRDWLYVEDHCEAILMLLASGQVGETYNVGGDHEVSNIELVQHLCELVATQTSKPVEDFKKLITFVEDRKGHDFRYAINCEKLKALGWTQSIGFEQGIAQTVEWYINNQNWCEQVMK